MTPDSSNGLRSTRRQPSPQQLVTRHNAVMFYGIAAASLLEAAIALRAGHLLAVFDGDPEFRAWIERVWWPAKSAHARQARAYVESMWPEFDWSAAWEAFAEDYRRVARPPRSGHGIAGDALACSACAAQAAAFYRGLGAAADDTELRELLLGMAADEAAHFDSFRRCYERHRRRERLGVLTSYRTILSCASRARDVDVQLAFSQLGGHHWFGSAPLQALNYGEFVARMGSVVRRHLPLGPAQWLLFKPWLNVRDLPAAAVVEDPPPRAARRWSLSRPAGGVYSR